MTRRVAQKMADIEKVSLAMEKGVSYNGNSIQKSLDDLFVLLSQWRRLHQTDMEQAREELLVNITNDRVYGMSASAVVILVSSGIVFWLVTQINVVLSQRQKLDEQMRDSEARFRSTFDQAAVGIAHVSPDGNFIRVNNKLCDITGYTEEELLGKTFQEITHSADLKKDINMVGRVLVGEVSTYNTEKRYYRKDGSIIWVSLTVSLLRDEQGKPRYFISVIEDINSRKKMEQALERLNTELENRVNQRTQELLEAKEIAEKASEAKSEFLSRMSHELRTPLNAILGFGQLLNSRKYGHLNEEQRDQVSEVLIAGRHLLELVDEVLELSKIESGTLVASMEEMDLKDEIESVLSMMAPMAEKRRVEFVRKIVPKQVCHVYADRRYLTEVLSNFFSNAIKYNKEQGKVYVECDIMDQGMIRVTISDTGIGIPDGMQSKLFQPFERLGRDYEVEGTGIGLSITKALVEKMGGAVGYSARSSNGASFWFELKQAS